MGHFAEVRVSEMKQRATKLRRVKKSCVGGRGVLEISEGWQDSFISLS